jgi:hypothetical protein
MASGINSTFRQIGLATSIAALGSIFATSLHNRLSHALAGTPLVGHESQILSTVRQGQVGSQAGAGTGAIPSSLRGELQTAIRSSFTGALDILLVVTAVLALVGGVASVLLIRDKDFIVRQPEGEASRVP